MDDGEQFPRSSNGLLVEEPPIYSFDFSFSILSENTYTSRAISSRSICIFNALAGVLDVRLGRELSMHAYCIFTSSITLCSFTWILPTQVPDVVHRNATDFALWRPRWWRVVWTRNAIMSDAKRNWSAFAEWNQNVFISRWKYCNKHIK